MAEPTLAGLKALLDEKYGGLLVRGAGARPYDVCARELRAAALGQPVNDHPDAPDDPDGDGSWIDIIAKSLNDGAWDDDPDRTRHCLVLALPSADTAPQGWAEAFAFRLATEVLPALFDAHAATIPGPAPDRDRLHAAAAALRAATWDNVRERASEAFTAANEARKLISLNPATYARRVAEAVLFSRVCGKVRVVADCVSRAAEKVPREVLPEVVRAFVESCGYSAAGDPLPPNA